MSKRLLLLNLIVVSVGVVFSVQLVRTFLAAPSLPSPPLPVASPGTRAGGVSAPPPTTEERARGATPLATYDVVASKSLFNPSRSETGAASAAPAVKPFLHGIVLGDGASTAFLEDPTTKKIRPYKLGDPVAGGQLERIEADRVVIRRGEGTFEVLLRDPQKPKPVAAAQPAAPGTQPRQPGVPAVQPAQPSPTAPQPLSPTLFRRPQAPTVPPVRNAPDS